MELPKLTRRSFLKLGVGSAALVALESQFLRWAQAEELTRGGKSISRTTGGPRRAVPSTCLMCPARCGILGFVEEGFLVKIEGNPKDPNSRGRLCARGQAGVNLVYDTERQLFPVRRSGARGGGDWQRITWEEAFTEVAAQLKAIQDSGRPEEFVLVAGMEGLGGISGRFLRAFGTPSVLEESAMYQANKRLALDLTWGENQDIADLANTRYILNFGANSYDAHPLYLPLIQRLIDGRMNGAKLVTFDPRVSNTAAKSDEWLPIKPGTDGMVALAMANVIMNRRLYDAAFVERWVNVPVAELARHLAQYTPEMAEAISGVKAGDIERVAQEFATTKPATTLSAGGVSRHLNGTQNERAIALLNALTGNVDIKGGYCLPRRYELTEPEPRPPQPVAKSGFARPDFPLASHNLPQALFGAIREGRQKVGLLMTDMANPAYSNPDPALSAEVLKDERLIPFYVACDTQITESSRLADLILPLATYLESWDLQSMPAFEMVPFVSLRQPVIPPMGESLAFHDILIQLAHRLGGGMERYFNFGSMENYLEAVISSIEGLMADGGMRYLRENGVWYDTSAQPSYRSYERNGFRTPSGKFEVFSSALGQAGFSPLPGYQPIPGHDNLGEDLILVLFQWNVHHYSRTANAMWLSEIVHDNPVWINPETAQALGIKKGQEVRITSSLGTITSRAWLTQGIHPRVLAMGACVGHWASGRIAQAQSFESRDPNTKLLWWGKHGNGVHPHHIIPIASDPVGGGQAWMDTKVSVAKA